MVKRVDGKPGKRDESPRLRKLREQTKDLSGLDRTLLDDLLVEYDSLATMTEELRVRVEKEGVMVVKEVGTVNNRHYDTVENPVFTTYSKTIGTLGGLAKKVSAFAESSDGDSGDTDELAAFVRRRG